MVRTYFTILFASITLTSFSQIKPLEKFLSDSSLIHASVSLSVVTVDSGNTIMEYNGEKSLAPASVLKLVTTAAALELLGPQYTFRTVLGYTGIINTRGKLKGNIIIKGGGDPSLGSGYFSDNYKDFLIDWVTEIKKLGVRKVEGGVITDDSYYDFLPVPSKWLWEDTGNYYGAGVFGLSLFDNTYEIHLNSASDSSHVSIKEFVPAQCRFDFTNRLTAEGLSDKGYIFSSPYGSYGWLSGSIPVNREDYVLKASISDPPLLIAKMVNEDLEKSGIHISKGPTTVRLEQKNITGEFYKVTETVSPDLADILEVLNHESVNLYAEHLLKELGKQFKNNGSTEAGIETVTDFLKSAGINTSGIFIEDGSGLSPSNAINTRALVQLLLYMRNKGKYFSEYYNSIPDAGKEGTLKNYFIDPVFDSRLKAKSGSMTRVRSYAGYFTALSGKQMIFAIIINNYTGKSKEIVPDIEELIKSLILDN